MAKKEKVTKIFMAAAIDPGHKDGIGYFRTEDNTLTGKFEIENIPKKFQSKERNAQAYVVALAKLMRTLKKEGIHRSIICTNNAPITNFLNDDDYQEILKLVIDMPPKTPKSRPAFYSVMGQRHMELKNFTIHGETVDNTHPIFKEAMDMAIELSQDSRERTKIKKQEKQKRERGNGRNHRRLTGNGVNPPDAWDHA